MEKKFCDSCGEEITHDEETGEVALWAVGIERPLKMDLCFDCRQRFVKVMHEFASWRMAVDKFWAWVGGDDSDST
jgi:hypothetical protein